MKQLECGLYDIYILYIYIQYISSFSDHANSRELLPLSPRHMDSGLDPMGCLLPPKGDFPSGERPKKTPAEYRALWKTAIHQQIILLRMEKENQRLEGESVTAEQLCLSIYFVLAFTHGQRQDSTPFSKKIGTQDASCIPAYFTSLLL